MSAPLTADELGALVPGDRVRDVYGRLWYLREDGYWHPRGALAVTTSRLLHSLYGPLRSSTVGVR